MVRHPRVRKPNHRPQQPPKKPRPQVGDGLLKMMELHSRLKTWLETPDPPRPPKPIKPVKLEKTVPPFDIQEIPAAMRKVTCRNLLLSWSGGS